jgi:hypothetical protein
MVPALEVDVSIVPPVIVLYLTGIGRDEHRQV